MIKLKKIFIGIFVVGIAIGTSVLLTQSHNNTHAANTIATSYQVVTISGTTDGLAPNASVFIYGYSADGNIVLFKSNATNLPNASTNGAGGLYEYNITTNAITRVDVSTSGVPANGPIANGAPSISETGRYVVFATHATNLVDGVPTANTDVNILQRDVQGGSTVGFLDRYDASGSSAQSPEQNLGVSNDGRFVLMASRYINTSYPYPYAMLYGDNKTGTENWTTLGIGSDGADNPSSTGYTESAGQMSCDGSILAYLHTAGGTIQIVDARNSAATQVALASVTSINPSISCNGRYILYATINRTDITVTPSGMNANFHLVRYDRITKTRSYIDTNSTGAFSTSSNQPPYGSGPNYFAASVSDTGDVVLKYNNNMYLKHFSDGSGTLEPIAKNTSGGTVTVTNGVITNDGRYILFQADPYSLGLAGSPAGTQVIRVKTGL